MGKTALIAVDVQKDFLPGGALGVPDGGQVIPVLTDLIRKVDLIVQSRDYHPANHCSFADPPEFRDGSWPAHCVQGTDGAYILLPFGPDVLITKGDNPDKEAYSAFEGLEHGIAKLSLDDILREQGVTDVIVGGLALDYCVLATALDAKQLGYNVTVPLDATRPVTEETGKDAIKQLLEAGVFVTTSVDLASVDA